MDRFFSDLLENNTPKFNDAMVRGYSYYQMRYLEQYLDTIIRQAAVSFPKGFEYHGIERATPYEEYNDIIRPSNNRAEYEISRSDIYLIKINFTYNGEPLSKSIYLYLPYVSMGGLIHLSGTMYRICPILTDRVISVDNNKVFIRLLRNKINIMRTNHPFVVNGIKEVLPLLWSPIRGRSNEKMTNTSKMTTITHYLLGKYGYTEMFNRYMGYVPVVGTKDKITPDKYPPDKWVIITASGIPPKPYKSKAASYTPHPYAVAIEKDKWTPYMQNMVAGMMYIWDLYPDRFDLEMKDDPDIWRLFLSYILDSETRTMDRLLSQANEHYRNIDLYIDDVIRKRLKESGYDIETFYDLLALVLEKFVEWINSSCEIKSMVYNRYVDTIYYVMYEITTAIFKISLKLSKDSENKNGISKKDIEKTLQELLTRKKIFDLIKSSRINLTIGSVDYAGDNMYPKVTSAMELQEHGEGVLRKTSNERRTVGPDDYLRGPDLSIGSLLFLPKKTPTPKVRLNPFAWIEPSTGNINPPPEIREILDELDNLLQKEPDNSLKDEFIEEVIEEIDLD